MTKSWWAVILDNFIQTIVIYLEMRWQQTLCIANQIDYIIFKLCDKKYRKYSRNLCLESSRLLAQSDILIEIK